MRINTGLVKVSVLHDGATFIMTELDTRKEADIGVKGVTEPGMALRMKFVAAVKSWVDVTDGNGNLECTDKNKKVFFDFNKGAVEAILQDYLVKVAKLKREEKKISKNGPKKTLN